MITISKPRSDKNNEVKIVKEVIACDVLPVEVFINFAIVLQKFQRFQAVFSQFSQWAVSSFHSGRQSCEESFLATRATVLLQLPEATFSCLRVARLKISAEYRVFFSLSLS